MHRRFSLFIASALPLAMFLLASCKQNTEAIVIKSVTPDNIKAGVRFNVQPDGTSAITINATGATSATVPILSGVELPAVNIRGNGSVVTAVVPDKLYQKAGNFPLFLFDKKSGEKSNQIVIVVK